jgi:hypothetical protein
MINLTPENAFVGATVYFKDDKKYIYKVNQKSIYIGGNPWGEVERIKNSAKYKWTALMRKVGGEKVDYNDVYITEAELSSKDSFIKKEKKQKRYLSQLAEVEIKNLYKERVLGKNTKTIKVRVEYGKGKKCFILDTNKRGQVLISGLDGKTYFFYDVFEDSYSDFNLDTYTRGVIEWPQKQEVEEIAS